MGQDVSTAAATAAAPGPVYLAIADALRTRIVAGEYPVGAPLPSERELCRDWSVSRMTLRRALELLEREGRVHRDATRGTFVSEPKVRLRIGSFSQEVARAGQQPGAELFWAQERAADRDVAAGLGIDVGDTTFAIQRLRRSNGVPLAIETTHYRADLVPGLLERDLGGSLWAEIEAGYDLTFTTTAAELELIVLDDDMSARLQLRPASTAFRLERRTCIEGGVCLEFAQDVYRADRVSLIMERAIGYDSEHDTGHDTGHDPDHGPSQRVSPLGMV